MRLLDKVLATPRVRALDNSHKRGRKSAKTEEEFLEWEEVAVAWAQGKVTLKQVCETVKLGESKTQLKLYYHLHRALRRGHVEVTWKRG